MSAKMVHCGLLFLILYLSTLSSLFAARLRRDQSDIFFTNYTIPRIRIQLDTNALAALRNKYREYVKGTVTEGGTTYRDVGIHLKGQYATFQGIDGKPSLTLNFDKFVKKQSFHGLDKFHLNNSAQDPTYLCEVIGRELFQAAGVPTARTTHARVELNERDLGLFVLVEGTDKSFLKRHFKNPNGNLYDSGFRHDISDGIEKKSGQGPDDHSDLHALLAAAGEVNHSVRMEKLSRLLDMERFYNMLALELMIRHFDGYAISVNNYRVYHDPTSRKTAASDSFAARLQARTFLGKGVYQLSMRITATEPVFLGPHCPVSLRIWGMDGAQVEMVRKNSQTVELRCYAEVVSPSHNDEVLMEIQVRGMSNHTYHLYIPVLQKTD